MNEIKADDAQLLRQFRTTNTHTRPLELNRVLNRLRIEPLEGKHVIVCTVLYKEWAIGVLGARRGDPITILEGRFSSLAQAQWQMLKIRWSIHTTHPWPEDLE